MYLDMTYIVLVLPAVILSLWASWNVKRTFKKYAKVENSRGLTGADAARRVLDANGLRDVPVEHISGELSDHYDPAARIVRLSDSVWGSSSVAAVGVACHEVGHAIQNAQDYLPIKIRQAIIPATALGEKLSVPLLILGLLLSSYARVFIYLAYAGVALYALCAVFQLVTLPTEFDASRRALVSIQDMDLLDGEELTGAKKVLSAAALTYVAALATTLMQLLRFIVLVRDRDR
jgi:Zn-dependent membrane protease YugP